MGIQALIVIHIICLLLLQITAYTPWRPRTSHFNCRRNSYFPVGAQKGTHTVADSVSPYTEQLVAKKLAELKSKHLQSVSFPTSFSAVDRSYVHDVSARLGLVSKSAGSGQNRCITVTATAAASHATKSVSQILGENSLTNISFCAMTNQLLQGYMSSGHAKNLGRHLHGSKAELFRDDADERGRHHNSSLSHDLKRIQASHAAAQSRRAQSRGYSEMQSQRRTLPAHHYKPAVCSLVKNNTVTLVR